MKYGTDNNAVNKQPNLNFLARPWPNWPRPPAIRFHYSVI